MSKAFLENIFEKQLKTSRRLPIYVLSALLSLSVVQGGAFKPSIVLAQESTLDVTTVPFSGARAFASPLKSGDLIRITVVDFPDLSGEQIIPTSGIIQIPMVGDMQTIGLTPRQLAEKLTDDLKPYVRRPRVSVTVLELSPLRISVTGEVLAPGPRLLDPSEISRQVPLTLSSVLKLSGGVTPNADLRSIVIRRTPFIVDGQAQRALPPFNSSAPASRELSVNLWQAIVSGELEADPLIYDGDEIIVPTAQLPNEEQKAVLESTVAPDSIQVQVIGEVRQPGDVSADPTVDMNGAIAAAGGFSEDANQEEIRLLRLLPDGRVASQDFEFGQSSGPLLNGDLLVVGRRNRSNVRDIFDVVGSVLNPINLLENILD